jgi:hypothetical protein
MDRENPIFFIRVARSSYPSQNLKSRKKNVDLLCSLTFSPSLFLKISFNYLFVYVNVGQLPKVTLATNMYTVNAHAITTNGVNGGRGRFDRHHSIS